jgi:hypothetical protein
VDEGDYHKIYSKEVLENAFAVKYYIVTVKDDIIYSVLDSVLQLSPLKNNIVIELSFDTLQKKDTCIINLNIIQKINKSYFLNFDDFFIKKGDTYFSYREYPILVHYFNYQKANDYFVLTKEEKYFTLVANYDEPYWLMEKSYQNKNKITKKRLLQSAHCSFQFKIIDKEIADISTDCNVSDFKTINELLDLYGQPIE